MMDGACKTKDTLVGRADVDVSPELDSIDLLQTRKRHFHQDVAPTRLPLLLQNNNVPSPSKKMACLHPIAKSTAITNAVTTTSNTTAGDSTHNKTLGRLAGDELITWQNSWKKIMKESTVYFEGVSEYNHLQMSEFKRASRYLKLVGCTIAPFFDNGVTIIVSRRQYSAGREYLSSDIFSNVHQLKIKVWDYNKVFRFLKNLGVNTDAKIPGTLAAINEKPAEEVAKEDDKHLYNLLREEKIYGTNDRDLNAKRDDLHYLERNYLYVYDLSQHARPIAIREWHEGTFPVLNLTMDGKCPFISEPMDTNSERKKLRRLQKFSATQSYRNLLKRVTQDMVRRIRNNNSVSEMSNPRSSRKELTPSVSAGNECDETIAQSTSSLSKNENVETGETVEKDEQDEQGCKDDNVEKGCKDDKVEMGCKDERVAKGSKESTNRQLAISRPAIPSTNSFKEPIMLSVLKRNSSCINPLNPHTNTNAGDMMASGYNGASNALNFSMDTSLNSAAAQGNGLGPLVSQVPSRNLTHLKRRIIIKKQQQSAGTTDARKVGKDLVPGYCENCRVKYDHFEEHIKSNRHRNFACNDENFKDIDRLISLIGESKALGHITSNGDYRYSL